MAFRVSSETSLSPVDTRRRAPTASLDGDDDDREDDDDDDDDDDRDDDRVSRASRVSRGTTARRASRARPRGGGGETRATVDDDARGRDVGVDVGVERRRWIGEHVGAHARQVGGAARGGVDERERDKGGAGVLGGNGPG